MKLISWKVAWVGHARTMSMRYIVSHQCTGAKVQSVVYNRLDSDGRQGGFTKIVIEDINKIRISDVRRQECGNKTTCGRTRR